MPDERGISRCSSCEAEIVWVVTEANGKRMPIDAEPVEDGTFLKLRVDPNGDKIVRFIKQAERAEVVASGRLLFASHFQTCPDAGEFRKTR